MRLFCHKNKIPSDLPKGDGFLSYEIYYIDTEKQIWVGSYEARVSHSYFVEEELRPATEQEIKRLIRASKKIRRIKCPCS